MDRKAAANALDLGPGKESRRLVNLNEYRISMDVHTGKLTSCCYSCTVAIQTPGVDLCVPQNPLLSRLMCCSIWSRIQPGDHPIYAR